MRTALDFQLPISEEKSLAPAPDRVSRTEILQLLRRPHHIETTTELNDRDFDILAERRPQGSGSAGQACPATVLDSGCLLGIFLERLPVVLAAPQGVRDLRKIKRRDYQGHLLEKSARSSLQTVLAQ